MALASEPPLEPLDKDESKEGEKGEEKGEEAQEEEGLAPSLNPSVEATNLSAPAPVVVSATVPIPTPSSVYRPPSPASVVRDLAKAALRDAESPLPATAKAATAEVEVDVQLKAAAEAALKGTESLLQSANHRGEEQNEQEKSMKGLESQVREGLQHDHTHYSTYHQLSHRTLPHNVPPPKSDEVASNTDDGSLGAQQARAVAQLDEAFNANATSDTAMSDGSTPKGTAKRGPPVVAPDAGLVKSAAAAGSARDYVARQRAEREQKQEGGDEPNGLNGASNRSEFGEGGHLGISRSPSITPPPSIVTTRPDPATISSGLEPSNALVPSPATALADVKSGVVVAAPIPQAAGSGAAAVRQRAAAQQAAQQPVGKPTSPATPQRMSSLKGAPSLHVPKGLPPPGSKSPNQVERKKPKAKIQSPAANRPFGGGGKAAGDGTPAGKRKKKSAKKPNPPVSKAQRKKMASSFMAHMQATAAHSISVGTADIDVESNLPAVDR